MKAKILGTLLPLFVASAILAAPVGTAFTYQGRLQEANAPVTGLCDFAFTLLDACPNGNPVGSPSLVALAAVPVTNGLFTVALDFGGSAFNGNARWLQIQVKTNLASTYATLSPCQELKPTPQALYATTANLATTAGSLPWSGLTGVAAGAGLTLTGNGFSLDTLYTDARYDARYWKLEGNGGTNPGANFLGTTDSQPLVLKTDNSEQLRVAVDGKVGIGTATPVDKLHVAGSAVFKGPDPWIDVRAYEAKGDGMNDDTGELQAALDAVPPSGAVVFVPPGTYIVSQWLTIRSGTVLKGAGAATVFKRSAIGGDIIFKAETVTNVTLEDFAIDMNGTDGAFANGVSFRYQCSNIRIRDLRVLDSTGTNPCCRVGIQVLESDHVWIERNHLTDGLRIKAGGVGDTLFVTENAIEDGNDNAITIVTPAPNARTINYVIRNNVVKASRGVSIYIGDDGRGTNTPPRVGEQVHQDIIVDGNLIFGPVIAGNAMILVKLGTTTRRLHLVNNILVNQGDVQSATVGIETTMQDTDINRPGSDFLIANNSVEGAFDPAAIWVAAMRGVRIANNQVTYTSNHLPSHYGIRLGNASTNGDVNEAIIQGNLVRGCHVGLAMERSSKVQVIGNSFTDMVGYGILLSTTVTNDLVSAEFLGNIVGNTAQISGLQGEAINEYGPGTFDTQYLFNDLRNNASGAFGAVNTGATRLGNLGTDEYIQRHVSKTATWDRPGIPAGSFTSTTVPVTGAAVGDTVAVGLSPAIPPGVVLSGAVTAPDTVTVTLANLTGGALDPTLASLLRADVWKH